MYNKVFVKGTKYYQPIVNGRPLRRAYRKASQAIAYEQVVRRRLASFREAGVKLLNARKVVSHD